MPLGVTASSRAGCQLAVYTMSHLTLRWLQHSLNAHLTHSLPLWCNPVEVISFTGLSTSANMGGRRELVGGSTSVFNQPATDHSPKQKSNMMTNGKISQQKIELNI